MGDYLRIAVEFYKTHWGILTAIVALFTSVGAIMKWYYSLINEIAIKKHREREDKIDAMVRVMEEQQRELNKRIPNALYLEEPHPAPGEDPEIVREAWRKLMEKRWTRK
jgi:hypothetical protein